MTLRWTATPSVKIEVVPAPRTDGAPHWWTLRVSNSDGGRHEFGFEPTVDDVLRKWSYEACVFAVEWCKPLDDAAEDGTGLRGQFDGHRE